MAFFVREIAMPPRLLLLFVGLLGLAACGSDDSLAAAEGVECSTLRQFSREWCESECVDFSLREALAIEARCLDVTRFASGQRITYELLPASFVRGCSLPACVAAVTQPGVVDLSIERSPCDAFGVGDGCEPYGASSWPMPCAIPPLDEGIWELRVNGVPSGAIEVDASSDATACTLEWPPATRG